MNVTDVAMARPVAPLSAKESEDSRWRQWKAKGRADDLRFRRGLRTVLVAGAAVIAAGGALWFALLT